VRLPSRTEIAAHVAEFPHCRHQLLVDRPEPDRQGFMKSSSVLEEKPAQILAALTAAQATAKLVVGQLPFVAQPVDGGAGYAEVLGSLVRREVLVRRRTHLRSATGSAPPDRGQAIQAIDPPDAPFACVGRARGCGGRRARPSPSTPPCISLALPLIGQRAGPRSASGSSASAPATLPRPVAAALKLVELSVEACD